MSVQDSLQRLTQFYPLERLEELVRVPTRLLPEQATCALPSIVVGSGGLTLDRILLVSERFLCDIRTDVKTNESEFDFVEKQSVRNYRAHIWTHEIREGDVLIASFEIAEVELIHVFSTYRTKLSYAGERRDDWLSEVVSAIPIELIVG